MNKNMRFGHKILLAAALIVTLAFTAFTSYNDYKQRNAIRNDLNNYLHEMGSVTANNIQTWLNGRRLLVENLAQNIALNADQGNISQLLEQNAITTAFVAGRIVTVKTIGVGSTAAIRTGRGDGRRHGRGARLGRHGA